MGFLFRFLYRNLKGYRPLVFLAILVSFADVAVEILQAYPLKYIQRKFRRTFSFQKISPKAILMRSGMALSLSSISLLDNMLVMALIQ